MKQRAKDETNEMTPEEKLARCKRCRYFRIDDNGKMKCRNRKQDSAGNCFIPRWPDGIKIPDLKKSM